MSAPARPRHFLELDDLSVDELYRVLELAEQPVAQLPRVLEGRGMALLFEKPSARTRHSMEMAVFELGGHPVTVRDDEVGLDVRESTEDVARVLSGYHGAIGARVFDHARLERLAGASSVPVVNLLSDSTHPIQTLADLLTIQGEFGRIDDLTIAWIGDANNVARPLALAASMVGSRFRVAHPEGFGFSAESSAVLARAGCTPFITADPRVAVAGADVVCADAWYSMGQEAEAAARRTAFAPYRVDARLMSYAAPHAIFLHCLPAHRGDEVTDEVLDGPQSRAFPQAHNRLHASRGLLAFLLGDGSATAGPDDDRRAGDR